MKLVPKLTLALVLVTCALFAFNGYMRVRREVGFFEADRTREHDMIGRSLSEAVLAVWKSQGEAAALHAIDTIDHRFTKVHIRWVDRARWDGVAMDASAFDQATAGQPVTRIVRGDDTRWFTYVPIEVDGARRGALELSETATSERRFAESTIEDTIILAGSLALLGALLSFAMGLWLVGAPIRTLTEKARRIGRGDFTGPLVMDGRDELAELGREMNGMCERLSATLEQLRHADRLATVGKLASGIAHELGTPLNVVAARADMIVRGDTTPEESREYAKVISGAAMRMTKIIRQLLQFARRTGPQKAERKLRELAAESVALLRPLADKQHVRVEVSGDDAKALVDAGQLQQVVTNLVMNGIQAMPKGGLITIDCRMESAAPPADVGAAEGPYVCVRVKDEGQGITADDLPHVFEPFFTTKDVGEGTGLGLAVSYGIIRDHGGWISAESTPGKGSMFTVHLPPAAP